MRKTKPIQLNKFAEPELKILSDKELRTMWDKWHGVRPIETKSLNRKDANGDLVVLRQHREMQFMISKEVAGWDLDYGYGVRPGFKFAEAENLWKQYCRYEGKREEAEKNELTFSKP